MSRLLIGVDVGGSKLAAGLVDTGGRQHAILQEPVELADVEAVIHQIICLLLQLASP